MMFQCCRPQLIRLPCVHAHRERRIKFETYLISERKKMETFRLRETKEFLSIDELKEKCDTMDVFMDILKVHFELAFGEAHSGRTN